LDITTENGKETPLAIDMPGLIVND
jgi:hypothetical protein